MFVCWRCLALMSLGDGGPLRAGWAVLAASIGVRVSGCTGQWVKPLFCYNGFVQVWEPAMSSLPEGVCTLKLKSCLT